ncbi:MAG: exodeoxyribonuclease VII small subunit [Verrucomicrobiales bacterium]|jgi:exodeoxyribonuclease VII small subunit|nr:exodeoxyribonuclease VII small subunit [Verrucomicrobiales bacterium]
MRKAKDPDSATNAEPAFEDALAQLEELVRDMESDQMPLEDLIKNYEQGTQLYRVCEKRLDEARGRIEIIRKKRNEEHVLEPFAEDCATADKSGEEPDSEASQENGELF